MSSIIGAVLVGIGLILLVFEIAGICKQSVFVYWPFKFVWNLIFGLLTLLLIAVGILFLSGVIHI